MGRRNHDIAVDATLMRQSNAALVLRLIWESERISRADIARRTGLSASTVSDIIGELGARELVVEKGTGQSSGGRRPILLGINEDHAQIIGIEIGGAHITVVGVNPLGEILASRRVLNPTRTEPEETLETLYGLIDEVLDEDGIELASVLGLGVAVPCPVTPDQPGQLSRLILPEWSGIDLREELHERYQRPVYIENDANAGALAELWWGARDEVRDLAYVKVATGVGAGFIIDGKLYRGADGSAGEIGHLSIDPLGPRCICGSQGCLTTLIGTGAILERAARVQTRDKQSVASIPDFVEAAVDGDLEALALVDFIGEALGTALAGLLNTLNPRMVVLGGELTELGDVLFDPLRVSLRKHALFSSIAKTSIVASRLGTNAIAVGATAMALDAALDDPDLFPSEAKAA